MRVGRRKREANRRTIIDMLETTPAQVPRPASGSSDEDTISDLDFDWGLASIALNTRDEGGI